MDICLGYSPHLLKFLYVRRSHLSVDLLQL
uniref:Uncharacterized protein n=1 Tax=Myoviridae sp. ctCo31 TaxID=2825053 RepID=A0A8S5UM69_9CAUD|nr:MAG TPA: hypothetical protein [Myoviridae sp. ctCo31]